MSKMLIILGGLPGTGKSSIGKKLAEKLGAVYLRIDSIEQALKKANTLSSKIKQNIGPEGYMAAYAIACDNLNVGLKVVADSVNPISITRADWRKVATENNAPFIEIEIICSDKKMHQERVETRKSSVQGLQLPTWQEVMDRDYEAWKTKHLTIDTASYTVEEAVDIIITKINA